MTEASFWCLPSISIVRACSRYTQGGIPYNYGSVLDLQLNAHLVLTITPHTDLFPVICLSEIHSLLDSQAGLK